MSIRTRSFLKDKFETGDFPTQQDFADWIDSFLHLTEDAAKSGLAVFDETITIAKHQAVIHEGVIKVAVVDHQGVFDANNFVTYPIGALRFGFAFYDNNTNYVVGNTVVYKLRLYECIQDVSGVAPDDANGGDFWTEINANDGVYGNDYQAGYYKPGDVVMRNNGLWELVAGAQLNSTDFETEQGNGDWENRFQKPYVKDISKNGTQQNYTIDHDFLSVDVQNPTLLDITGALPKSYGDIAWQALDNKNIELNFPAPLGENGIPEDIRVIVSRK